MARRSILGQLAQVAYYEAVEIEVATRFDRLPLRIFAWNGVVTVVTLTK